MYLEQNRPFVFDDNCQKAFMKLKIALVSALIIVAPNWTLPLELNVLCKWPWGIGDLLGQQKTKVFHPIYFASRTLSEIQLNYTTTRKEFLAVVFGFDKFSTYLAGIKVTIWIIRPSNISLSRNMTCHASSDGFCYFKSSIFKWKIVRTPRIKWHTDCQGLKKETRSQGSPFKSDFSMNNYWCLAKHNYHGTYADIINFLVSGKLPLDMSKQQLKLLFYDAKSYC